MASAIPQERLPEIVREAQSRTGVPVVAAALAVGGRTTFADAHERPFRIDSITKSIHREGMSLADRMGRASAGRLWSEGSLRRA